MNELFEKTRRPPQRRKTKAERKTHSVYLELNEAERDALDAEVARHGIEMSRYLRTLILAVHAGELPADRLFVE